VFLTMGALGLAACAGSPQARPEVEPVADASLGLAAATTTPAQVQWWRDLGDPQLDALMSDALSQNPSLAGALARVRDAAAQAEAAGARLQPYVSFGGSVTRERVSENYIYPPPYAGASLWEGQLGVSLSWYLDFWGRQADIVRQAAAFADAAALDAAGARLALSGATAQAYVEYGRAAALEEVAARAESQRARLVELTRRRITAGLDTEVEHQRSLGNLSQIRVELEQTRAARQIAVHALAELSGQAAGSYASFKSPTLALDTALPVPAELPADLVARRPDLLAARRRVDAATAGREAAAAAFYPDVNLSAFAGFNSIGLDELLQGSSHVLSIGPAIHLPLFDAGRLRAEHARATADLDVAVASYNAGVLRAVRECADQAERVRSIDLQIVDQQAALAAAERAFTLAEKRYAAGLANYLVVLDAETEVLAARRQRTNLLANRLIARINLLVALGGDFAPPGAAGGPSRVARAGGSQP
jgi:NodT family efflux transporter outer membrane factor (OMF) lipoprotein